LGQWQFTISDCDGIELADQLWAGRYILKRLGEEIGIEVLFEPKPIKGEWHGCGLHISFSCESTRDPKKGLDIIRNDHIPLLKEKHMEHMFFYGDGNHERLNGKEGSSLYDEFTCGESQYAVSVRIPAETIRN